MTKWKKRIVPILVLLLLWQIAALCAHNKILVPGPFETAKVLAGKIVMLETWSAALLTTLRIAFGFFLGAFSGIALGALSERWEVVKEFLAPIVHVILAVPVASFAVIVIIWWGSDSLSTAVSLLVVFPQVYEATCKGIGAVDVKKKELGKVFSFGWLERCIYILMPAMQPFLLASFKVASGMAFKSGVAAELIGVPDKTIGEALYLSKIYLDTAGVFAWTILVILLSFLFDKLVQFLANCVFEYRPSISGERGNDAFHGDHEEKSKKELVISNLSKSFGENTVIQNLNQRIVAGEPLVLNTPSGSGKTTLLRIVAGLERPDQGAVSYGDHLLQVGESIGFCFQDNVLLEAESAVTNVALITKDEKRAREALQRVLPGENLDQPVSNFSGGMQRRVCVVRAMEAGADVVCLDEPFAGLDEETKEQVEQYIKEKSKNNILLIATHTQTDL